MSKLFWSFCDDLKHFDLDQSGAVIRSWRDSNVLSFNGMHCFPVLLNEALSTGSFLIQAEVACTPDSFAGIVFGAIDSNNFELVYISADNEWNLPNLQYDPVMNGSSTWQIYHGPRYQALVPVPSEEWVKLSLRVHPDHVAIYIGEAAEPHLIIPKLQLAEAPNGKIGMWGSSQSYMRNLSIEAIESTPYIEQISDAQQQVDDMLVTEWMVSKPYNIASPFVPEGPWFKAHVEDNGVLNLNRLYTSEKGTAVQVKCSFYLAEGRETRLSYGFSDRLRLWVNDKELYEGEWKWHSPGEKTDGRIRFDYASVPIQWRTGWNTIAAEVTSEEVLFGWGIIVKTGLSGLLFVTEA